jgi:hypothetical protein
MECETMTELEAAERNAQNLQKAANLFPMQVLYAQWVLDAQRVQRDHAANCEACRERP